jgi:hypothetical protein
MNSERDKKLFLPPLLEENSPTLRGLEKMMTNDEWTIKKRRI